MGESLKVIPGQRARTVMTLVGSMDLAAKIVKSAQWHHLNVRNFDKAEKLLVASLVQVPEVVILDFEAREADAFKFLKAVRENAVLKRTAVIGFVSHDKRQVKNEAESAGCLRVFLKTEFWAGLDGIWLRYAA